MEPPAQRADGRQTHSNQRRLAQLGDDAAGWLTAREPPLCLLTQFGPRVRTGSFPLRCTTDPAQMRTQRLGVPPPGDSGRTPDRPDTDNEVPPRAPSLELLTAMRLAEPDGNAVGQEMLSPRPLARTPADRAHRQLPNPRPFVVTQRHAHRMTPPHVPNLHRSANSFTRLCVNFRHIHRRWATASWPIAYGQLALRRPLGLARDAFRRSSGPFSADQPALPGALAGLGTVVGTHDLAFLTGWPLQPRPVWSREATRNLSGAPAPR